MGATEDIKSSIDVNQVAQLLGVDQSTADQAVDGALDQLVSQLSTNVDTPQDAVALTNALGDHMETGAYGDQIDLNAVDTADGEKIVQHVFGQGQVQQFAGGGGSGLIGKLLPILAPIVLSYLARRLQGSMGNQQGTGGLGDLLGGVLGGGMQSDPYGRRGTSSGGLGDLLGSILGGAAAQQQMPQQQGGYSSGGLGDLLGSILGGGAQQPDAYAQPTYEDRQPVQPQATQPAPGRNDGLTMDEGPLGEGYQGRQTATPASDPAAGGGLLGQVLKDLLGTR